MLAEVQYQAEGVRFLRRFVEGQLVSPLMLVGPDGVGRRFSVIKAVQEAFCTGTHESGCPCSSCYTINKGIHPDIVTLAAGEKDIGVDSIREIIDAAKNYPSVSNIRCFIIDGADRFTIPAANAFLKTLEEPPARSRFFLITRTTERVIPTILSRCGQVRYSPLPDTFVLSIVQRYEEDSVKALVYTRMSEGSVGNAIQYWGSGKLTLRDQILKTLLLAVEKDLPSLFSSIDAMNQDLLLALKFLEQVLSDVLIVHVDPTKIINTDRLDDLKKLEKKAILQVWAKLARKIKDLQIQYRVTRINISFHLKAVFIESFL
jgi:DNA polymerase III delta prime subunit